MRRPHSVRPGLRRGVILLVVISLLTLFALVGLSFVLYADAEAASARLAREAEVQSRPDLDPRLLLAFFLGQLVCDVDDQGGVFSALRGHSLVRLMYGYNDQAGNDIPFSGTGRLHLPSVFAHDPSAPPEAKDDFNLINYTYFPADGFLRDPERLGSRTDPGQPRGPYACGFNAPYTYPDLNNLFLAAVQADGTVLLPSFHRPWLFGSNDPKTNPNWTNRHGKYLLLRPRPLDMGPGFPYPEDEGGDVKNLIGAPGGNDSIWLDLGAPVRMTPTGRKYKPLFAPLIVDLDNRVNVNVHGNIRGAGGRHVSNQGWGPWEVNLSRVLPAGDEWRNLFTGTQGPVQRGRYGADQKPAPPGTVAASGLRPHFYAQVDFDGGNESAGGVPTGPLQLPGLGMPPGAYFPTFPPGYGNGAPTEGTDHPLLANIFQPLGDDGFFPPTDLEALLRYGDTGSPALTSELFRLCPTNFRDARRRRLVTTTSFDLDKPGLAPWLTHPALYPYQVPLTAADQAPSGPPIPFPPLAQGILPSLPPQSEFGPDGRALTRPARIDVNRPLTPYPLPSPQTLATYNQRFDVPVLEVAFRQAQKDRQELAHDIYRRLLAVTGVVPPVNPATPTDAELLPRRWLAQLAVNMVDFLDEDDIHTAFPFYTEADGLAEAEVGALTGGEAELPRYWVFGTELPHLVLNEVLAAYQEPAMPLPDAGYVTQIWVELFNPFRIPPGTTSVQPQDDFPVLLYIPALPKGQPSLSPLHKGEGYAAYQLVIANQLVPRPGNNDNVLGRPELIRVATSPADFAPPAHVEPQRFFLLGPPSNDANHPFATPTVPANTPQLRLPSLQYKVPPVPGADDRLQGVTVLLRRLANPHLPPDLRPTVVGPAGTVLANPWYNPYVTVDYLDKVPLRNATDPAAPLVSWGKRQPYAAHLSQLDNQVGAGAKSRFQHSFGQPNNPPPNLTDARFDWLVHLDRPLISPLELLHVSGYPPHQLTHQFVTSAGKFQHRVPWFDPARRLYRVFEFLATHQRALQTAVGGRLPGKINLNTIWDPETFLALCDPQPGNRFTEA
ncbi:MAG: hypothetical protein L0Z62_36315, partial [Gemmataceae bacterium]|nr:hypothetical protein [Gemmataceae bacterium]